MRERQKEKIRFAFELHDLDNSGYIDREELKILIKQSFIENSLDFDEFQLDLLVEDFFKRADPICPQPIIRILFMDELYVNKLLNKVLSSTYYFKINITYSLLRYYIIK